jgi:hypothetical protein
VASQTARQPGGGHVFGKDLQHQVRPRLKRRNSKDRNKRNAGIEMSCILNFSRNQNHRIKNVVWMLHRKNIGIIDK